MSEAPPPASSYAVSHTEALQAGFLEHNLQHVFNLMYRALCDVAVAQDITQEAFITVLQRPTKRNLTRQSVVRTAGKSALSHLRETGMRPRGVSQAKFYVERAAVLLHESGHVPAGELAAWLHCSKRAMLSFLNGAADSGGADAGLGELLPSEWRVLEREMLGNISVGLAAARCIDHVHSTRRWITWTAVAAVTMLAFALVWMTKVPRVDSIRIGQALRGLVQPGRAATGLTIVRSGSGTVSVRNPSGSMSVRTDPDGITAAQGTNAVSDRSVDPDTGQVTETTVYAP